MDDARHLTGDACVTALLRAGFQIRHRGSGLVLLRRGASVVMVPDVGVIEPFMLRAILRSAGISQTELEAHLAHVPTRSGFFARAPNEPASDGGARLTDHGSAARADRVRERAKRDR